jgi:DNA-binding transcriptional MocR family regulator
MHWVPDISHNDKPRYMAVAGAIVKAIDSGELSPGAQLPPQRDLAQMLGVTVGTIGRAYSIVKKRRLVTGEVGRGTFVIGDEADNSSGRITPEPTAHTLDLVCYRSPVQSLNDVVAAGLKQLGEGSTLPAIHKYPPIAGFITHRTAGATWIARYGLEVTPDQIVLTGGAQQGIMVALTTLCKAGDTVMTESLTYSGLRAVAAMMGLNLLGIEMDDEGMIPAALVAACEKSDSRVLYLQPTLHNPTAAMMPLARRKRIAEIARKYNLTIIEDDAAASALSDRPAPVSAFAPERSCYITSVSKSIGPAFRVGYIAAPLALQPRIANALHTMCLSVSPIIPELVTSMIADGTAERLVQNNLHELKERHLLALETLKEFKVRSHPGAPFMWIMLPSQWDPESFVDAAKAAGVSVVSAAYFAVDRANVPSAIRISLNSSSSQRIFKEALFLSRDLLEKQPDPQTLMI